MRHILLLGFFLMALPLATFAQVRIGLAVGHSTAALTDVVAPSRETNTLERSVITALVRLPIYKPLSIQATPSFVEKGAEVIWAGHQTGVSLKYFEVPVHLRLRLFSLALAPSLDLQPYVLGGGYMALLRRSEGVYGETRLNNDLSSRKRDYGYSVGGGLSFVRYRWQVFLDAIVSQGTQSVTKGRIGESRTYRNRNVHIKVGVAFHL